MDQSGTKRNEPPNRRETSRETPASKKAAIRPERRDDEAPTHPRKRTPSFVAEEEVSADLSRDPRTEN
jgi:hypothetical protein